MPSTFIPIYVSIAMVFGVEICARLGNLRSNLAKGKGRDREYNYLLENTTLSLVKLSLDFLILTVLLFSDFILLINKWALSQASLYLLALKFFTLLALIRTIYVLPFALYRVFKIERDYGFNSQSILLFTSDLLKSKIIEATIAIPLILISIYFYRSIGDEAVILIGAIVIFLTFLLFKYTVPVFVMRFNKLSPLPTGALRVKLEKLTEESALPGSTISIMDASKRSSKANAFFAGVGKTKHIVLFDTLLTLLADDEIVAVMAHEITHYQRKHVLKGYLGFMLGAICATGFIYTFLKQDFTQYILNLEQISILLELFIVTLVLNPFVFIANTIGNIISRRFEYQADKGALRFTKAENLVRALNKLGSHALSNSSPGKVFTFLYYSHPPLKKRAEYIGVDLATVIEFDRK